MQVDDWQTVIHSCKGEKVASQDRWRRVSLPRRVTGTEEGTLELLGEGHLWHMS